MGTGEHPISIVPSPGPQGAHVEICDRADSNASDQGVRIYLAGSVPKGSADGQAKREMWTDQDEDRIRAGINAAVETLNPNKSGVRRADFYANFGCDLHLVDSSDVVFVDGRSKRGIGVGAEMMFAQMRGTRVVAICPDESAYRRRDVEDMFGEDLEEWIHPFVFGLTDHIAATLDEAINWVNGWLADGRPLKRPDDMEEAITYYRSIAAPPETPALTIRPHRPAAARRAS